MNIFKYALGMLTSSFFCSFGLNAAAEGPDILPGLWENKIEMSSKSGQIEAALKQAETMLKSLPPEQQQMMKDMMAKQGVNFDFGNRTAQTCLTQEQIDNFELSQNDSECNNTVEKISNDHYKMSFKCDDNTAGSGEYKIANSKSYSGNMVMDINMGGQKDVMTLKQQGTWVSSDCGNLGQ